ncbi:MAG: M48 family metallopeptidase, partial [Gemmatimonadaceae bacterium]
MTERWSGYYYDGRTADRMAVAVTFAPGGLRVERPDGTSVTWPISQVRQTQGSFSSEQVRIEHGTDPVEAVFITEPGFARAVRERFPQDHRGWRDQSATTRLLALAAGGLAVLIGLYVWGAPLWADWASKRVPMSWEHSLGQDVAQRMAPESRQCGDAASHALLGDVLQRLLNAGVTGEASQYRFRMVVLKDTLVNAFAAPGGFIAVNSGLLAAARTPEEFAGVLAHEVSHVTKRHSTRAVMREMPLRLALSAIAGGSGAETAASVAGTLGALRYRRGDEAEADREGMRMLAAAKIDPAGTVSFMRTLEEKTAKAPRFVSYLTTHPHTADRVAALQALAREHSYQPVALMDADEWARVRKMCST